MCDTTVCTVDSLPRVLSVLTLMLSLCAHCARGPLECDTTVDWVSESSALLELQRQLKLLGSTALAGEPCEAARADWHWCARHCARWILGTQRKCARDCWELPEGGSESGEEVCA